VSAVEAVVFDFGGVIITPITRTIGRIAEGLGTSVEVLAPVLMGPFEESSDDHPWHRLERGEIATEELQVLLAPHADAAGLALRGDEVELLLAPAAFEVNEYVLDAVDGLRARGVKVALLTNGIRSFRDRLAEICRRDRFDVYVDSAWVGMRKPEARIFEHVTELLGVAPSATVFLDDFAGNLAAARAHGWRTIHVTDPRAALAELEAMLAQPDVSG
jgi:epoxide hydrolase-like predicted phosphatase